MNKLHKYLQEFVGNLQQLLNENQTDADLIQAIKDKWKDNDPRWHFLIGLQNKFNPRAGGKSLNSLGDMGGDGTGGQENELKNPNN
ncbi:MAG: hypothetical protein KAG43_04430 [Candidatus Marithrix sp.]|nr:hypothetical protein [Candidatus Marithrix sp.]